MSLLNPLSRFRQSRWAGPVITSLLGSVVVTVAGCGTAGTKPAGAGTTPAPAPITATGAAPNPVDPANRFKVTGVAASFYKLGPQQPGGPDLGLKQGARLTLVKRGFGYSQVRLEDGTTGFVGTEDIARLTPQEIAAEAQPLAPAGSPNARGGAPNNAKPGSTAAKRRGRPGAPNIPISPPDEPGLPAAPDPTPRSGPVPTFRY